MLKKGLFLLLLMLALPSLASAYNYWYIATSTSPTISGVITPPSGADYATSGSTTNVLSPTVTTADFTVEPAPTGYNLSYVTVDGIVAAPISGNTYRVNKGAKVNHTLTAVYALKRFTITTNKIGNGAIDPSVSVTWGSSKTINVTPASGYQIFSISADDAVLTSGDGRTYGAYTFTNIQADKNVSVEFTALPAVVAKIATSSQAITVEHPLLIDGSMSTFTVTPTYTWSVTPTTGATVTPAPDGKTATFSSATSGTYTIKLELTGEGAPSSVASVIIITATQAMIDSNVCIICHLSRDPSQVAAYQTSRHASTAVASCQVCHTSATSTMDMLNAANACVGCHTTSFGTGLQHAASFAGARCILCHEPHSGVAPGGGMPSGAHFNNITSGRYPASYMTSKSQCPDCHFSSAANQTARQQWYSSGHARVTGAPWTTYDFKTRSGCVQCHTSTGFIAYSTGRVTSAWGVASDKTKEVLTCAACHKDMTTGVLRTVTPIRPYADDTYSNRNVGKSNICMDCHSGTNNGKSILARLGTADFNSLGFIPPHSGAAAGTLHGQAGYHFPGQGYSFYSSNSHRSIGIADKLGTGSAGPCIACHKNSDSGHSFNAGASALCGNCHGTSMSQTVLSKEAAGFENGLAVLKAMLFAKGYDYTGQDPYFANTSWGTGQAGGDTMGAAFNYVTLLKEPGAFAHNPAYAKQLIVDSIDCLYNGRVTGSIDSALASMVSSGAISQLSADKLSSYKAAASCTSCHDPLGSGSHGKHLADGVSCGECHNATALSGSALVHNTQLHLNGQVDVLISQINNKSGGVNFNKTGNSCSGVSCHGNGTLTVGWGGVALTCENCHAAPLAVMNGVTAQDRSQSVTLGHGKPGIGNKCLDCHDAGKQHLGGAGRLRDTLTGVLNTECNFCHNNTSLIQNFDRRNMRSHISANGTLSACSECHDPHGTSNRSMIRTSILGTTITYTMDAQLIDQTTNMGFCQVCHKKTKYFLAGIPETSHDTTGCLICHDHRSPNGGFLTRAVKQCDSCHGYPPAPRQAALPASFGTMNNWSSATFERYSGGGGAHLVDAHVPRSASPPQGWINCVMCHDPGYHRVDLLVDNPPPVIANISVIVQSQYRFGEGFTVYTGAKQVDPPQRNVTGSCFNLSCHMSPSSRWSTER